jgi:predicted RNase H-like HicB family nuclease
MKTNVMLSVCLSGESSVILTADTYEEALKNAQEVLELLIETSIEDGESLPKPINFRQSSHLASTLIKETDSAAVGQQSRK